MILVNAFFSFFGWRIKWENSTKVDLQENGSEVVGLIGLA
jgi:hypothetical protein